MKHVIHTEEDASVSIREYVDRKFLLQVEDDEGSEMWIDLSESELDLLISNLCFVLAKSGTTPTCMQFMKDREDVKVYNKMMDMHENTIKKGWEEMYSENLNKNQ